MNTNAELTAKRYAKALWEAVGTEGAEKELSSLERFVELYVSSDDLQSLIENPAFTLEDKRKVLAEITSRAAFSKDLQNFLLLLLHQGRLSVLGAISEAFKEKIMTSQQTYTVKIETALPLSENQKNKIVESLEKEHKVKFIPAVDIVPDLVAGVRLHFLGKTVDVTLTGVLFQMRQKLMALENVN
jgi:F-type H+-transporting ATPase subunit delta